MLLEPGWLLTFRVPHSTINRSLNAPSSGTRSTALDSSRNSLCPSPSCPTFLHPTLFPPCTYQFSLFLELCVPVSTVLRSRPIRKHPFATFHLQIQTLELLLRTSKGSMLVGLLFFTFVLICTIKPENFINTIIPRVNHIKLGYSSKLIIETIETYNKNDVLCSGP